MIPTAIECYYKALGSTFKTVYQLEARYGSSPSSLPMWDNSISYQGLSSSGVQHITYRKSSGDIVGYVLAKHCLEPGHYCAYPSSGVVSQIADGGTPFGLQCPKN